MSSFLKAIARAKDHGIKTPIDWLKMLADGNLFVTILEKGDGRLVGTDDFGNRYFEDNETGYTRKRWVIYKDMSTYNPTSVPPEWHGWLNYINDFDPVSHNFKKPVYAIEAYVTKTGQLDCYKPKGTWDNPTKRNWLKYEAWQPPQA
jgi:NADH dehydrogenase (ubiquinone) 1 alpha subcomplex subunit 12